MFFFIRRAHRVEGGKIRLEIKVSWVVALTGLEAERSVSTMIRLGLKYVFFNPQERRSPGWRWKDPSRTWGYRSPR